MVLLGVCSLVVAGVTDGEEVSLLLLPLLVDGEEVSLLLTGVVLLLPIVVVSFSSVFVSGVVVVAFE